jgi:putative nucleotidyltransferase with HDIG domain
MLNAAGREADTTTEMALDPTIEEQELLADTLSREHSAMTRRELLAGALAGSALAAAVAALWIARPVHHVAPWPVGLCVVVLVLASRVSFDTPFGFTVMTQLAFVPLLFAAPLPLVPVAVVIALTLARVPDVLRGEIPAGRLLQPAGNAWFAVGAVAVFVIAGRTPAEAGPGLLIAALLAEFAADFVISSLRYRLSRGASLHAQLRETWVYAIDAALSGIALVAARRVVVEPAVVLSLIPVLGLFAVLARERRERLESLLELNSAYRGTALVLGDVVAADDGYTGEHCKSVVGLALDVAELMQLGASQRRNLEFAALLHDVGKIVVPKRIINKPGKLDEDEWEVIRTHTIEGQRMLERVGGFMGEVGLVVRSHHERWDGSGYPDGLAGERIPLEARIVACCDAWNAMRTDRSYRRALSHEVALAELRDNSGSQFDPVVAKALIATVALARPPAAEAPDAYDRADADGAESRSAGARREARLARWPSQSAS